MKRQQRDVRRAVVNMMALTLLLAIAVTPQVSDAAEPSVWIENNLITNKGIVKLVDCQDDGDPAYSPDGSKVLFVVINPKNMNDGSIQILDLETQELTEVIIPDSRYLYYPDWAPTGDKIVFTEGEYTKPNDIYVINLDGTNKICLTTDQIFDVGSPCFSPDGKKIAYFSHIDSTGKDIGDIWIMDADGNNKMQLTNDEKAQLHVCWSPDGSKIAYTSGIWPNCHIWIMDADGNNKKQLTFGTEYEAAPAWSNDGKYITYQKQDYMTGAPWEIWVMNADGTKQTRLTDGSVSGMSSGNPDWHPSGTKIVFASNYDIYEMELGEIIPVIVNEGETVTFVGNFDDAEFTDNYIISWEFGDDRVANGNLNPNHIYADNGFYDVTLTIADDSDGFGTDTLMVTVNNVAPEITSIALPVDPVEIGTPVNLYATFTDMGIQDTHTYEIDWDLNSEDDIHSIGDATNGIVDTSYNYKSAGVYTIKLTITDDDTGSDEEIYKYVVVYDTDGGFVTGGGWINSPEGAYVADPDLIGTANFGFVSKYKNGATVPTGQTQFQFQVANLNFHSEEYQWLVIAGAKAQFKGTGTINGIGDYGFLLTAIDGELKSDSSDKFRIKIWQKATDQLVYDNMMNAEDTAEPSTVLQGGSIKIHK